jgi:hypothetical protein
MILKYVLFIVGGILGAIVLFSLFMNYIFNLQKKASLSMNRNARKLMDKSVKGKAEILSVNMGNQVVTLGVHRYLQVFIDLKVTSENKGEFKTRIKTRISEVKLPQYQPGAVFDVRFNPDNPNEIAFESEIQEIVKAKKEEEQQREKKSKSRGIPAVYFLAAISALCLLLGFKLFDYFPELFAPDQINQAFVYKVDGKKFLLTNTSKENKSCIYVSQFPNVKKPWENFISQSPVISNKNRTAILGLSDNNIWAYSMNPELGLHSLDPVSLKIKHKKEDIFKQKPELNKKIAKPNAHVINYHFVYDDVRQKLAVQDQAGYRYLIDPENLTVKTEEEYKIPMSPEQEVCDYSVEYNFNYLDFEGNSRQRITYRNSYGDRITNEDYSFTDPAFLIETNKERMYEYFKKQAVKYKKLYNLTKDEYAKEKYRRKHIDAQSRCESITELNELWHRNTLLQPSEDVFFILDKESKQEDQYSLLYKFRIHTINEEEVDIEEEWKVSLRQNKEDEDADFVFSDYIDNKLTLVRGNKVYPIDIETGKY